MVTFAQSASRLSAVSALLLGWRPHEFWAATPAELQVIFAEMDRAGGGERPPAPGELANLMEMFPDG